MMYDLGEMNVFGRLARFFKFSFYAVLGMVMICVMLTVAVRIGNLIIGF